MVNNIIWLGVGTIISLCGFIIYSIVSKKLRKRPIYTTKHGVRVFAHMNEEAKRTSQESLELYMEAYIAHLAAEGLFTEKRLRQIVKGTRLFWKIFPYWNPATKQYETGTRSGDDIVVGWQPKFERTSLAHEYMHLFLDNVQGNPDPEHRQKQYWQVADGFVGVISY